MQFTVLTFSIILSARRANDSRRVADGGIGGVDILTALLLLLILFFFFLYIISIKLFSTHSLLQKMFTKKILKTKTINYTEIIHLNCDFCEKVKTENWNKNDKKKFKGKSQNIVYNCHFDG